MAQVRFCFCIICTWLLTPYVVSSAEPSSIQNVQENEKTVSLPNYSPDVIKFRRNYLDATEEEVIRETFKTLFKKSTIETLQQLESDPNLGIALQARWQLQYAKDPAIAVRSNPERFMGYFEGRTGVKCPNYWSATLTSSANNSGKGHSEYAVSLYAPLKFFTDVREEVGYKASDPPIWCLELPEDQQLHETEREIHMNKDCRIRGGWMFFGKKPLKIHPSLESVLMEEKDHRLTLRGEIGEKTCFCVVHEHDGNSYPLMRLERPTGRVLWKSQVRVAGHSFLNHPGTGPPRQHYVWIVPSKATVAVFGITTWHHYVELFDARNGVNILRFFTNDYD